MADSTTTTYSFTLPEVGASADSWGTKLNANWSKVDDLFDGTVAVTGINLTTFKVDSVIVTASAAELNKLDGLTATTTELNYTDGVTSNIQTQLNGKATSAQGALADSAVQPDDNVSFGTGSFSGEIAANGGIALGDNDKATFGASDDLEIYHDGSKSIIHEKGQGDLEITANNLYMRNNTGEYYLGAVSNAGVFIRYDNSTKLATTSTGVDVDTITQPN